MRDELPITEKTPAADALTELQIARCAVEQAGMKFSDEHTRENKIALRKAQEHERELTLKYYNDRLKWLASVTDQQTGVRHGKR